MTIKLNSHPDPRSRPASGIIASPTALAGLAAAYAAALRTVNTQPSEPYHLVEDGFRRGSLMLKAKIFSSASGGEASPEIRAAEETIRRVEELEAHRRAEVDRATLRILRGTA